MPNLNQRTYIQLFGYEVYGGRTALLWRDTSSFFGASGSPPYKGFSVPSGAVKKDTQYDAPFTQWCNQKRDFTQEELPGVYAKIGDNGQTYLTQLFADGTIQEKYLFDTSQEWGGLWTLENGILKTTIGPHTLFIVASSSSNIHSAIQTTQDLNYFKFIRIKE